MPARGTATNRGVASNRGLASGRLTASGRLNVDGTGGGGGGGDDLAFIDEQSVGGGGAASVTFSSIPGTYRHLQIFYTCRCDNASAAGLLIRFNGDNAANYDYQHVQVFNGTTDFTSATATTTSQIGLANGANGQSNSFSNGTIFIPYYAQTVQNKVATDIQGAVIVGPQPLLEMDSVSWRNTAAITQIVLLPSAGSWISGSKFSLYGIS